MIQTGSKCCRFFNSAVPRPNEENNCSSCGNRIFSLQNRADEFGFGESDVYLEGI